MTEEFSAIREKRLPTEFAMIERREDLKNFAIERYQSSLGLVIHIQIPLSEVASTLIDENAYDHVFEPRSDGGEDQPGVKVEEEKEPGDFGESAGGDQALKANQQRLFPLEVRQTSTQIGAAGGQTYEKIEKKPKHFEWEILLDHKYPFS